MSKHRFTFNVKNIARLIIFRTEIVTKNKIKLNTIKEIYKDQQRM